MTHLFSKPKLWNPKHCLFCGMSVETLTAEGAIGAECETRNICATRVSDPETGKLHQVM